MQFCPIKGETQSTARKTALQHGKRLNVDHSLVLTIFDMEMRRCVITKEHLDQEAIESADSWHCDPFPISIYSAALLHSANTGDQQSYG